jgi:AcrR family transcriptional regulator
MSPTMAASLIVEPAPLATPNPTRERVIAAALRCVARWGVSKTTVDDVAREAGCSRATLYRAFPGGKDHVLLAAGQHELARLFAEMGAQLDRAATLEDLLVAGVCGPARFIAGHATFQLLRTHEPALVMPNLTPERMEALFSAAAAFATPHLARFLDAQRAADAAEWLIRLVMSYCLSPSGRVDPTDEADVRTLVRSFLLPALSGPTDRPTRSSTNRART